MSLLRLARGASAARASARALQLLPSSAAGSQPTPVAAAATARGFCTSGEKGYNSTIDFESPEGHEFEQVVDVGLSDVSYAAFVNRQSVAKTDLTRNRKLQDECGGMHLYFKHEYRLPTGSFKERGARFALHMLDPEAKKKGVIAASAGNHAQAMAYHARELGIPCTVYMPTIAPLTKIQACRAYGANVVVQGDHIGEARDIATKVGKQEGLTYINGYDHPHIIAGAGTMGLEILEQVPDVAAVVVPVGGAGLIAGTAVAIKSLRPDVRIIGVEPDNIPSLREAMAAGHPVQTQLRGATLADGLLVPKVGLNAFHLACKYVDEVVTVREKNIALAMLRLIETEKCIVEGGGATGLAAALQGALPADLAGKKVVFPLCGGNVDTPVLGRVIDRGLAADSRLIRMVATVDDRPGGIARLTAALADTGASVKDLFHERAWLDSDFSSVHVIVVAETRGEEHTGEIFDELHKRNIKVRRVSKVHRPMHMLEEARGAPPVGDAVEPEDL